MDEGPFFGLEFENVPALLGNLCIKPDGGVDWLLWDRMCTDLPLDRVLELAEIDLVDRSWREARTANREIRESQP